MGLELLIAGGLVVGFFLILAGIGVLMALRARRKARALSSALADLRLVGSQLSRSRIRANWIATDSGEIDVVPTNADTDLPWA